MSLRGPIPVTRQHSFSDRQEAAQDRAVTLPNRVFRSGHCWNPNRWSRIARSCIQKWLPSRTHTSVLAARVVGFLDGHRCIMECEQSKLQRTLFFSLLLLWLIAMIFGISDSVIAVRVVAWLGIVLGVITGWFGLQQMSRKGPTLIINESGIDDKRLGVGQIPWTAISSVSACKAPLRSKSLIELWLSDESAYVSRMPRRMRMVAPTLKANGHSPFVISMTFLNPGFGAVYEYILRFVPAKEP